jgi:excinuclease ABC subunit A
MQFLADVELPCEECGGKRYKPAMLEVKYKNRNIYDVLNLTVREALVILLGTQKLSTGCRCWTKSAWATCRLGQSATTLSGGEAQRVKLASHLANTRTDASGQARPSRVLYILDEPTTGLHFEDVSKLLAALRKLIDNGGSLLVIEHNLDVLKCADWILDLGPEGGAGGGQLVAAGTPEQVAAVPESYTGQWLAKVLSNKRAPARSTAKPSREESYA